ncbi:cell division protein FtsZ [Alphaproteobacteria bacterium]|nr:cell division protein FtsZ [Alphaproteobacteria bacterium]
MTINLTVPQTMQELRPRITVVGVGGAGCNAVNNMISTDLDGVEFLVANTDGQALAHSLAPRRIQLGTSLTSGLGAGSKPQIGQAAAEESLDEIFSELNESNMIFITAGMGGGTGTGAAPVIARAAKERGILTVGVVTKPFEFEGLRRMTQADDGIAALQAYVDTLIVIPNQNLFRLANERTTFADAFHMADTVLHQGVCGVTDLMIKPGLINLDFADIKAVMSEMGKAMMGTGEASGEHRATEAAEAAINNPLLDDSSMKGARAVLINVTGGMDMTLFEVDEAANRIRAEVDPDATIIFGSAFDERLEGIMRVSVVATGIDAQAYVNPIPFVAEKVTVRAAPIMPAMPLADEQIAEPALMAETLGDTAEETGVETAMEAPVADMPLESISAEAHSDATDTGEQTAGETVPDMFGAATDVGETNPVNLQNGIDEIALKHPTPQPHQEASVRRRPSFIPAAPADTGSDTSIVETATITEARPSLMNKISGLWAAKQNPPPKTDAAEAKVSREPSIGAFGPAVTKARSETAQNAVNATSAEQDQKAQMASSEPAAAAPQSAILDLPHVDVVQTTLPVEPQASAPDDDLDIPAFLRRQAN